MNALEAKKVTVSDYHIVKFLYLHGALSASMLRLLLGCVYHAPLSPRTIANKLSYLQRMGLVARLTFDWRVPAPAPTLWGLDDTPAARKAFLSIVSKEEFDPLLWKSATGMAHRFKVPCKRGFLVSNATHDHIARNFLVSLLMGDGMIIDSLWPTEDTIDFRWLDGKPIKVIPDLEVFALFDKPRRLLVEVQNQTRPSKVSPERFRRYLRLAVNLRQHPPKRDDAQSEEEVRKAQRAQAAHTVYFIVRESKKLLPIYLDAFKRAMDCGDFGGAGLKVAQSFNWKLTDSQYYEMMDYDFTPLPSFDDEIWIDLLHPDKGKRAII